MLLTAMQAMTPVAAKLFDEQMKLKNVFVEINRETGKYTLTNSGMNGGIALTSDMLTKLSAEDLPQALDMLSKLYIQGNLSSATLLKMFEKRFLKEWRFKNLSNCWNRVKVA